MAKAKYYSPRLDRDLISSLYYAAKTRCIPMTTLASALMREALSKLETTVSEENAIVREETPAVDPGGRAD